MLTDAKEKSRGVLRADGYFRANFRSQAKAVPEGQDTVGGGFSERRKRETSRETARHVYAQLDRPYIFVREATSPSDYRISTTEPTESSFESKLNR